MQARLAAYLAGATGVRVADEGARVGLALAGIVGPGGASRGAAYLTALLVPHVLAAPVVGAVIDRSRRPLRVLAATNAGFGLGLVAAALAVAHGAFAVTEVALLLAGCCGPAVTGALTGQLAGLVSAQALPRTFGLDALTYNVSGLAGPTLAAMVTGAASPVVAVAVLGGTAGLGALVLAALVLATLPASTQPARRAEQHAGLTDGVRALVRDRALAGTTAASGLAQLGAGALPVYVAVAATRAGVPAAAGWVLASAAATGAVGSVLWTLRPARPARAGRVVVLGLAVGGLPLLLVAAAGVSVPALLVAFAALGLTTGPVTGALQTIRQEHAPDNVRSQVFSVAAGLKISCTALGAAVAGVLAAATSGAQFAVAGAVPLVAAACGAALLRRPDRPSRPTVVDSAFSGRLQLTTEPRN